MGRGPRGRADRQRRHAVPRRQRHAGAQCPPFRGAPRHPSRHARAARPGGPPAPGRCRMRRALPRNWSCMSSWTARSIRLGSPELVQALEAVLADVRIAVVDFPLMSAKAGRIAQEIARAPVARCRGGGGRRLPRLAHRSQLHVPRIPGVQDRAGRSLDRARIGSRAAAGRRLSRLRRAQEPADLLDGAREIPPVRGRAHDFEVEPPVGRAPARADGHGRHQAVRRPRTR